jgi:hypothetical protein
VRSNSNLISFATRRLAYELVSSGRSHPKRDLRPLELCRNFLPVSCEGNRAPTRAQKLTGYPRDVLARRAGESRDAPRSDIHGGRGLLLPTRALSPSRWIRSRCYVGSRRACRRRGFTPSSTPTSSLRRASSEHASRRSPRARRRTRPRHRIAPAADTARGRSFSPARSRSMSSIARPATAA